MRKDVLTDGYDENKSRFSRFCEKLLNSGIFSMQCQFIGSCSRDAVCLLRGTNWTFKYNSCDFSFVQFFYNNVLDTKTPGHVARTRYKSAS